MAKNYLRKALSGAIISSVFMTLSSLTAILIRIVLGRRLGVLEFGLFYAVLETIFMFTFLRDLALLEALVKFIPRHLIKEQFSKVKGIFYFVLSVQAVIGSFFFLILSFFIPVLVEHYFASPLAYEIVVIMGLVFIIDGAVETVGVAFNATYNIFYQMSLQFLRLAVALGFMLLFLNRGFGVRAPAMAYFITPILMFIVYYTLLKVKVFPFFSKVKMSLTKADIKEYLGFSLPVIPGTAGFDIVFYRINIALITAFSGIHQVGLYTAAFAVSQLIKSIWYPIRVIIFPLSSELWEKGDMTRLSDGLRLLYKYSMIGALPVVGIFLAFPKELLNVLYGADYVQGGVVLQLLGFALFLVIYTKILHGVFLGIGKSILATKQIYVGGGINIILGLLLIPKYGMYGAAISLGIGTLGTVIYGMIRVHEFIKIDIPWKEWIGTIAASAAFVGVILILKQLLSWSIMLEILACLIAAYIIYISALFLFRVVTLKEIRTLIAQATNTPTITEMP